MLEMLKIPLEKRERRGNLSVRPGKAGSDELWVKLALTVSALQPAHDHHLSF